MNLVGALISLRRPATQTSRTSVPSANSSPSTTRRLAIRPGSTVPAKDSMPRRRAGRVVTQANASSGLRPASIDFRTAAWKEPGLSRRWVVRATGMPASRRRRGFEGACFQVCNSRRVTRSAAYGSLTSGAFGKFSGVMTGSPVAAISAVRRNSMPEPSKIPFSSNSSAMRALRMASSSLLASKMTSCCPLIASLSASRASDCSGGSIPLGSLAKMAR